MFNLLLSQNRDWSERGLLVQDVLNLCKFFARVSFYHVKCLSNETAHALAKNPVNYNIDVIDLVPIPLCIMAIAIQQNIIS